MVELGNTPSRRSLGSALNTKEVLLYTARAYNILALSLAQYCKNGCQLAAASLDNDTTTCTGNTTKLTCAYGGNKLVITLNNKQLTLQLPTNMLQEDKQHTLYITLRTIKGNTISLTPITITIKPYTITRETLREALTQAAEANTPAQALTKIQTVILEINTQVKPLQDYKTIPETCQAIPIETTTNKTDLQAILRELQTRGEPASYALCAEDTQGQPILPSRKCIGSYIDKRITKDILGAKTIGLFTGSCTIATALCEMKWFGVGGLLGLGEGLLGCGLPALYGYTVRGRIAQSIKENRGLSFLSSLGLGGGAILSAAGGGAAAGILYYSALRGVTAERAAKELLALKGAEKSAGKIGHLIGGPRPSYFYSKKFLERVVDGTFRKLAGTSLPVADEAKILSSLEPKDYGVLAYVCRGGCGRGLLERLASSESPRDLLYSTFVEKYWSGLKNVLSETLTRRFSFANILEEELGRKMRQQLESKIGRRETKQLLKQYKEILELAEKDPEKAIERAREIKLITEDEALALTHAYENFRAGASKEVEQKVSSIVSGIEKDFITRSKQGVTANGELVKDLERSDDPLEEMRKRSQQILQESGEFGEETAEKVVKEAAEEIIEEAEETAKEARQGSSLVEGMRRNMACLTLGYLVGTLTASLKTHTLSPLSLETLRIALGNNGIILDDGRERLVIGGGSG